MTLRALVVSPEGYGSDWLADRPGSTAAAVRFVRWLLGLSGETCEVTVFAEPDEEGDAELRALLREVKGGRHRVERRSPRLPEFVDQVDGLAALDPGDAFVLYWLGHGAVDGHSMSQLLYLAGGATVDLRDIRAHLCREGRPARQLYVVDACRVSDAEGSPLLGQAHHVFARGLVPHPDWTDQLVLHATREGEAAAADSGGGVFTRRLLDTFASVDAARPDEPGARLDLAVVEHRMTVLEGAFAAEFELYEVDHLPSHFTMSRRGVPLRDEDYRPRVLITAGQAADLVALVEAAGITAEEEGEVRTRLSAGGLHLAAPGTRLPQLAGQLTRLPFRADGGHHLVTLCAALVSHPRAGRPIREWYRTVAHRNGSLPRLSAAGGPAAAARTCLVVSLARIHRFGGPAGTTPADRSPRYAVEAWLSTGARIERVDVPGGCWQRSQLAEAFQEVYAQAYRQAAPLLARARVEFIVERALFDEEFAAFPRYAVEGGGPSLLGDNAPVVLRDRWRHRLGPHLTPWEERAQLLDAVPAAALVWQGCAGPSRERVQTAFSAAGAAEGGPYAGIVLSRPTAGPPAEDHVRTALNGGAVLALWPRADHHDGCPPAGAGRACRGLVLSERLREVLADCSLEDVPDVVFGLRGRRGPDGVLFRNLTVLFDDPRRSPLVTTAVSTPLEGDDR